jgi:PHD/YefM family antitoxin component YafN of YafNO toxin-antitoxin module
MRSEEVNSTDEKFARFVENGCAEHRPVTIDDHAAFRESIATPKPFDEIDDLVDIPGPVQMRKQSEVSRVLSILDELENGKDGRA